MIDNKSPEEYAIWLVNTINSTVNNIDTSCVLAAAEVERTAKLLGAIKGMSKISKLSFLKKVKVYLDSM